jgi:hypothetical protein
VDFSGKFAEKQAKIHYQIIQKIMAGNSMKPVAIFRHLPI